MKRTKREGVRMNTGRITTCTRLLIAVAVLGLIYSGVVGVSLATNEITVTEMRQLTTDESSDSSPSWSPDGGRIVFQSSRLGNSDIWVMDADGSNQKQLMISSRDEDSYPAWSPDENKIAFVSDRSGNRDIWVIDDDGSNLIQVTTDELEDTRPAWSPSTEARRIVFTSKRNRTHDYENIWLIDLDEYVVMPLTTDDGWIYSSSPSWSPDGKKITFSSSRDHPGSGNLGNRDIWIMDADGSNKRILYDGVGSETSWSPDGSMIAFSANKDIWVMDADGSNPRQLTTYEEADWHPSWSPDGSKIAFTSYRSGNFDIWVMDIEITTPPPATTSPPVTTPKLTAISPTTQPPAASGETASTTYRIPVSSYDCCPPASAGVYCPDMEECNHVRINGVPFHYILDYSDRKILMLRSSDFTMGLGFTIKPESESSQYRVGGNIANGLCKGIVSNSWYLPCPFENYDVIVEEATSSEIVLEVKPKTLEAPPPSTQAPQTTTPPTTAPHTTSPPQKPASESGGSSFFSTIFILLVIGILVKVFRSASGEPVEPTPKPKVEAKPEPEPEFTQTYVTKKKTTTTEEEKIPVFLFKTLPSKCPSCSAPFKGKSGDACEHCGSIIREGKEVKKAK